MLFVISFNFWLRFEFRDGKKYQINYLYSNVQWKCKTN